MKNYKYFVSINMIGINVDKIRRDNNLLWFYNNDNIIFHMDIRCHSLKFHFTDEDTLYFDIVEVEI